MAEDGEATTRMATFVAELRRRRVFRVVVAYGIAAFAVLQVAEPVLHGLRLPDWILSVIVVVLGAGLPVSIALAWIYDVTSDGVRRTAELAAPASSRRHHRRLLVLLLATSTVIAAAIAIVALRRPRDEALKRIAVLPFATLNAGEEMAYFADGFHGELLTQLAKVSDLQVISRTSVMQYKQGARNLREIAQALGVGAVIEGSVQRTGDRVRIEARLVDAREDRQLWAERYDRQMADVFAIQTAVAEEIVGVLGARLSPEERSRIERRPTQSDEAYDYYLRAADYWPNRAGYLPENLAIAEQLFTKAVEKDPAFALAYAMLSRLHVQGFYWMLGESRARLEKGKAEADRAVALQPELAEGHIAAGYHAYYGLRDYDRALAEFVLALKYKPNDPSAAMAVGFVQRRRGQFELALTTLMNAVRLDPRSSYDLFETGWTLLLLRRYPEARQYFRRSLALSPDFFAAILGDAFVALLADGDIAPARETLRRLPAHVDHPQVLEFLELDPRLALELVSSRRDQPLTTRIVKIPMPLVAGWAHRALGDSASARQSFEAARRSLEEDVEQQRDDPALRVALARAYAGLSRNQDAIREARRAVELLPLSRDAFDGSFYLQELAAVYAETGETDAAVHELEHLLSIPSLESPARLRVDGKWAALRGQPAFEALLTRGNEHGRVDSRDRSR